LRRFLKKATADPTRVALVALRRGRNSFLAFLFCQAFFFAPIASKKKAGDEVRKAL